jgi:hypothetical protein
VATAVAGWWRSAWARLWEFHTAQIELQERWLLLNRPWEEEFLHWSHDGENWQLHGHRLPPPRRRLGTTSTGWCPHTHTAATGDDNEDGHAATPE